MWKLSLFLFASLALALLPPLQSQPHETHSDTPSNPHETHETHSFEHAEGKAWNPYSHLPSLSIVIRSYYKHQHVFERYFLNGWKLFWPLEYHQSEVVLVLVSVYIYVYVCACMCV